MVKEYSFSAIGKSHISVARPCQDAHTLITLDNGCIAAVVADGVGSCSKAEIGARIAVDTVAKFIKDNYPDDNNPYVVKSVLRVAFNRALIEIRKESERSKADIGDYDCTLMAVIYNEAGRGYYASVGDGAVLGLTSFGTYKLISKVQNYEGCVLPLRLGADYWFIDELPEELSSVIICTDGVLSSFYKKYLQYEMYIPLIMLLADPHCINKYQKYGLTPEKLFDVSSTDSPDFKAALDCIYDTLVSDYKFSKNEVLETMNAIVKNGILFKSINDIQDDKTLVCLYNDNLMPEAKEFDYYKEPNWQSVYTSLNEQLYPNKGKPRSTTSDSDSNTAANPVTASADNAENPIADVNNEVNKVKKAAKAFIDSVFGGKND